MRPPRVFQRLAGAFLRLLRGVYVVLAVAAVVVLFAYKRHTDHKEVYEPEEWEADLMRTFNERLTRFYDPKVKNS